jgi:hypothetical protein
MWFLMILRNKKEYTFLQENMERTFGVKSRRPVAQIYP